MVVRPSSVYNGDIYTRKAPSFLDNIDPVFVLVCSVFRNQAYQHLIFKQDLLEDRREELHIWYIYIYIW